MTHDLTPSSPDDGELLAAYLAGDLNDEEQAAVAARLAREPRLARQLDALAALLTRLRGVDDVTVPQGYAERLQARLDDERAAAHMPVIEPPQPVSRSVAGDGAAAQDVPGDGSREAAATGAAEATVTALSRRLSPVLGAAAVLVVIGLLGAVAVVGLGLSGGAGETSLGGAAQEAGAGDAGATAAAAPTVESQAAGEAAPLEAPTGSAELSDEPAGRAGADDSSAAGLELPVLSDRRGAVNLNLTRLEAAAEQLLGDEADPRVVAAALTQEVTDAPAFPGGLSPGACLEEVVSQEPAPVVPAAVRALRVGGRTRLAYAVAQPAEPDGPLATARVIVADAETCRLLDPDELPGS